MAFLRAEYTDDSRMLVVNYDEGTMGFLVDSSSETYHKLDPNDIDTATSVGDESSTKYIKSIGKKDGGGYADRYCGYSVRV